MLGTRSKKSFRDQATRMIKSFRSKPDPTLTDTVNLIRNLCKANDRSRVIYFNELINNEADLQDLENEKESK